MINKNVLRFFSASQRGRNYFPIQNRALGVTQHKKAKMKVTSVCQTIPYFPIEISFSVALWLL